MNKDKDGLILRLNWFYTLEVSQGYLYLTQAKKSRDDYIAAVLLKIAETEIQHAESLFNMLIRLDCRPYNVDPYLSYLVGVVPGKITPLTGTVNQFLYNYTLEAIAISDYKRFLKSIEPRNKFDSDLLELLMNNLIDEEFHQLWFKECREKLKN